MGYHSGTPDSASLAAQQAAGQTDLVTPAARTAAEALAARTVGALVKIGSDGNPADASVTDAQLAVMYAQPLLRQIACPAFAAGAATVAMGTNKASECVVAADRTLAQNSTLTLSATDAEVGFFVVTCRALALGYTLTIKNGGPGAENLYVFAASLTAPRQRVFYFDGTNFFDQGNLWVQEA